MSAQEKDPFRDKEVSKRKKPSRSQAAQRRKVLSEARRIAIPDIDHKIFERHQAAKRLVDVDTQLDPEKNPDMSKLDPLVLASLEAERIWLQFSLDFITSSERQSLHTQLLRKLEQDQPDVYEQLMTRNEHGGKSLFIQIGDKVMPPTTIGGYHTRR